MKSPRPQLRRDDPLDLSILVSGGKETNKDSLSSGERRGKSPALRVNCILREAISTDAVFGSLVRPSFVQSKVLMNVARLPREGVRPVGRMNARHSEVSLESCCLRMQR